MESPLSPEAISQMLKGIDRYNPENLSILERYVDWQIKSGSYDLPANLAVLKLYQFNQSYFNLNVVCQILLKGLANLPEPDFSLCTSLIDQTHLEDPNIGRLLLLHNLLETCKFTKFWEELTAPPEITAGVIGFDESVRRFICHAVSVSHQNIDVEDLRELLGYLEEEELNYWIETSKWSRKENGLVAVANHEENIKTKNIVEKVDFDKVQNVMSSTCV